MQTCSGVAQFWIALPATIAALGAFISSTRNRKKIIDVHKDVDGNLTRLHDHLDTTTAALITVSREAGRREGSK